MLDSLNLVHIIVAGLAVARITSLIVFDDIVEPIRHKVFEWSPPYDDLERGFGYQGVGVVKRDPGFLGRLIGCYHCTGVWVSGVVFAGIWFLPDVAVPVVAVAAIAQVSDTTIKATR